jgi:hypothetical protein
MDADSEVSDEAPAEDLMLVLGLVLALVLAGSA